MRVTSVIILLESGRQNVFKILYRKLRDDSNILLIAVNLYKVWKKQNSGEQNSRKTKLRLSDIDQYIVTWMPQRKFFVVTEILLFDV